MYTTIKVKQACMQVICWTAAKFHLSTKQYQLCYASICRYMTNTIRICKSLFSVWHISPIAFESNSIHSVIIRTVEEHTRKFNIFCFVWTFTIFMELRVEKRNLMLKTVSIQNQEISSKIFPFVISFDRVLSVFLGKTHWLIATSTLYKIRKTEFHNIVSIALISSFSSKFFLC